MTNISRSGGVPAIVDGVPTESLEYFRSQVGLTNTISESE